MRLQALICATQHIESVVADIKTNPNYQLFIDGLNVSGMPVGLVVICCTALSAMLMRSAHTAFLSVGAPARFADQG